MDSLVTRLRKPWFTNGCAAYQLEAADHIEKLEKALRDIASSRRSEDGCYYTNLVNIDRAKKALEQNP